MRTFTLLFTALPFALAACGDMAGTGGTSEGGYIGELPEGVAAIAAPYQNLNAVRIDPESGCYVYRYSGPVETTFLPLRTTEGRPICARAQDTASDAG